LQEFQRNGLTILVGRQAGYKLTIHDAAGDGSKQIEQFRQAIAAKPVAIMVSPVDPAALAAVIVEASTAGIPVIGLDKRMLNEGCASIAYSEQRQVGRLAGQTVIEALKRKAAEEGTPEVTGRVLQLRGAEGDHASSEIAAGFSEALQASPGIIIVHDSPAEWNAEKATLRTNEAFRLQKNFDVIYAHNDAIAMGAAKAAEAAGQRENILIVGTDGLAGQKRGIELVRGGELDATIVQPALVDLALQIILKLRSDKTFKPKPSYDVQPVAIVPKNADETFRSGTYKLPAL
jgi:ABC-type sugar transport system substrate-binding protein